MRYYTVDECKVIDLPKILDRQGNLTSINNGQEIGFDVKRIFYIYDIPGGEDRGAHAHKHCHQFIVAASGSFEVELFDGKNKKVVLLNRTYQAIHIPPTIWAQQTNFSSGAVCLVLASDFFDEQDYIRELDNYLKFNIESI